MLLETKINLLTLSSREWGESSNSFGTKLNQDGVEIHQSLDYQVLGMTLDHMITKLGLRKSKLVVPTHCAAFANESTV